MSKETLQTQNEIQWARLADGEHSFRSLPGRFHTCYQDGSQLGGSSYKLTRPQPVVGNMGKSQYFGVRGLVMVEQIRSLSPLPSQEACWGGGGWHLHLN